MAPPSSGEVVFGSPIADARAVMPDKLPQNSGLQLERSQELSRAGNCGDLARYFEPVAAACSREKKAPHVKRMIAP